LTGGSERKEEPVPESNWSDNARKEKHIQDEKKEE
jgi:hypothetical protein